MLQMVMKVMAGQGLELRQPASSLKIANYQQSHQATEPIACHFISIYLYQAMSVPLKMSVLCRFWLNFSLFQTAMNHITSLVGEETGSELMNLWLVRVKQQTIVCCLQFRKQAKMPVYLLSLFSLFFALTGKLLLDLHCI